MKASTVRLGAVLGAPEKRKLVHIGGPVATALRYVIRWYYRNLAHAHAVIRQGRYTEFKRGDSVDVVYTRIPSKLASWINDLAKDNGISVSKVLRLFMMFLADENIQEVKQIMKADEIEYGRVL